MQCADSSICTYIFHILVQGLPAKFCKMHLPSNDEKKVTLEDESGAEYETNFLGYKGGLGGGWAGFAMAHNLLEGDAAVFLW